MATQKAKTPLYLGFGFQIAAAMAAGLALGLLARSIGLDADGGPNGLMRFLELLGSLFVQLLKVLVPPLVFLAIVASIANLRQLADAAKLVWNTLLWFAITALIAVSIGLLVGTLMQPGLHAGAPPVSADTPRTVGSWLDFVRGMAPSNWLGLAVALDDHGGPVVGFQVLQIVVMAIAVGIAALRVGDAGEPFLAFARSALAIVRKLLWWVIRLTPLGTVGLFGTAIAQYGWDTLSGLGQFALAVYIGLALVLFLVYPLLLLVNGLSPARFFAGVWPATQLGFVSRSSIGTMPVTEEVTETRLGVPSTYAAFAVPLAATTKMDGCAAVYPAVAAIFIAQFYGIPLHIGDYLLIVLVSVIGSAATAGLTGAVVMLTLTLSTLGLPLDGVGLLLAIDPIIDMGRTAVNVTGQALVAVIVAKRQGILDMAIFGGGWRSREIAAE